MPILYHFYCCTTSDYTSAIKIVTLLPKFGHLFDELYIKIENMYCVKEKLSTNKPKLEMSLSYIQPQKCTLGNTATF